MESSNTQSTERKKNPLPRRFHWSIRDWPRAENSRRSHHQSIICRFAVVFLSSCYIHASRPRQSSPQIKEVERGFGNSHSPYYTRLVAVGFPESVGEPLQTLVQTVTGGGTGRLDELGRGEGQQHESSRRSREQKGMREYVRQLGRGIERTQARRVRLWRPSCWVISAGLMAF